MKLGAAVFELASSSFAQPPDEAKHIERYYWQKTKFQLTQLQMRPSCSLEGPRAECFGPF